MKNEIDAFCLRMDKEMNSNSVFFNIVTGRRLCRSFCCPVTEMCFFDMPRLKYHAFSPDLKFDFFRWR